MGQKKVILLCDDKRLNRKLVQAMLAETDYKVVEVDNGRDCLHFVAAAAGAVNMVLMDVGMRDMNGVDVCKALRSEAYNSDGRLLPIVAYTANSMAEDRINYIKAGFDEVLVKPITEEELLQILENYLA